MDNLHNVASKIADMIDDRGFECGCRFEDIELVLQAAVHLGLADVQCERNLFNDSDWED